MATSWLDDSQWLAPARAERIETNDGSFVLRSPDPLQPYARCTGEWLERWANETPAAPAFAQHESDGSWRRLSWAQTRAAVGRIGQGLLDLKLRPQAPIVVLSDNSLDHLLLVLAAMHIGVPVCTVSSAYSRLTKDYSKIHGILNKLAPALVYASDAQVYGPALSGVSAGIPVVFSVAAEHFPGALPFDELGQPETLAVMNAFKAITPDFHAKYLLTSGSTGFPKVVINTHRMLCANQQMVAQAWRFLEHEKPVIADWLPWSHTFGGNHNLHLVMRNGGSLIIDEGRPAPSLINRTVANLAQAQPTIWFNVPRGFDMALPLLERDPELARQVFERLRVVFYSGAALPQATWDRLQALAKKVRGEEVWLTTSWGSTETAPALTSAHWKLDRAGNIGLPLPGLELKFVADPASVGDKLELRVRGVSIFPGYKDAPELTAQAFDADGFYRIGDAGFLAARDRPEAGIIFNGRVAEDFKLSSGTWVSVGMLRVRMVSAMAPHVQDVVITGHDRDEVGLLIFPTPQAAALPGVDLRAFIAAALKTLKEQGGGSSQVPARACVLADPPNVDAGEITDKGYLNQRAVLARRDAVVRALHAGGPDVITAA